MNIFWGWLRLGAGTSRRPGTEHDPRRVPGFDSELLSAIEQVGFHPFILVRRSDVDDSAHRLVICATQNETPQFVNDLSALPRFAESKLLRAVQRALQLATWEAAELLFSWTKSQADGLTETVYVGKPSAIDLLTFHGYPAYGFAVGQTAGGSDNRLEALETAFHAYKATTGNDALRFALMEAFAIALGRALGSRGQYARGCSIIDDMLAIAPGSIHLKAAKHALALKIAGEAVPTRLEKYVGEDTRHLRQTVCPQPFEEFDSELLSAIEQVGFHPFILVRRSDVEDSAHRFVVCANQNEAPRFVDGLAALPRFSESKLLRAVERALQLETYEAADLLVAWTKAQADGLNETIYVEEPSAVDLPTFHGYPAYEFAMGNSAGGPDDRAEALEKAFHAYKTTTGNDALRFALMEAFAFALSRVLGTRGQYARAGSIVDDVLAIAPGSIHLRAAKHALALKIEGKPVPPRLEKFVGENGGDLRSQPFERFDVGPDGNVVVYCVPSPSTRMGGHPFIFVRRSDVEDSAQRFVVCATQNEAPQFANDMAALPRFTESKLLRAVERALQLETYEAAELLFAWTKSQADGLNETICVEEPSAIDLPTFHGYPSYEFAVGRSAGGPDDRVEALEKAFHAYKATTGNDALRFAIMEAFAFALSRALGTRGQYTRACSIVDDMLAITPGSIHMKASKHALTLRIAGKSVPPRLEKYVGEDNGYLRQFVCSQPFERFDIGPDGNVMVCCGHWLPTSIGNFMNEPVASVLNSARAQKIRASMIDGSYKYCNHLECGAMAQDSLPRRDDITHGATRKAVVTGDLRVDGVDQVMFAFDQTCNLSCPSCRTHVITEKFSQSIEKARAVEEKLLPMLPSLRILNINPAGELFGSKPSRKLLELINDERCPDLRLEIISNGTLFSEEEWNKFPGIHNKIRSIRISTDAATKETFEKLRRLGKYDVFLRNMRFLRDLRRTGVIPQLKFSFTYQLDNFREMRAFVAFCDEMSADFAIFERLQNIAFSPDEYRQKAVHYSDHPLYGEFIELIKDPVFRTHRVWHDFDYDGVEKMSGDAARQRSEALVAAE